MKRKITAALLGFATAVTLAATSPAIGDSNHPLFQALAGKTLMLGDNVLTFRRNGTLTGNVIEGTWHVKDGKFCRDLVRPASIAGYECQTVTQRGNTFTFVSPTGRTSTWTVQ